MGALFSSCPKPQNDQKKLFDNIQEVEGTFLTKLKQSESLQDVIKLIEEEFLSGKTETSEEYHSGEGGRNKKSKSKDRKLKSEGIPLIESRNSFMQDIATQLRRIETKESKSMYESQEALSEKTKQIDAQQKEIGGKDENIQKLQAELEALRRQHEVELKEKEDKEKNFQKLQTVLESVKKQHETEMKEMKDKEETLQNDNIEKASELDTLQNDLDATKKEKQEWERDTITAKQKMEVLEERIAVKDGEIRQLKEKSIKDVQQKDKEIMQLVKEHSKEVHEKDVEMGELTKSVSDRENQIVLLNEEMARLKKDHNKTILELNDALAEKNKQVQHLSTKLSAEMSTKLASDESNVENVSIKNRPMNVSEEYQIACTDQWLEAKTVLDDHKDFAEPVRMELLCQIIQVAEQEAKAVYEEINKCLEMLQSDAINFLSETKDSAPCNGYEDEETRKDKKKPKHMTQLFKELTNSFSDGLRITADSMDIGPLVQRIQESINKSTCQKELWEKTHETAEVETYIKTMSLICWKMAIQRPPMELKCSEKYLGDKMQDLAWNSKKPTDPDTVLIHVYPMLYHAQSLMAKGKVLLIHPEEKK